MPFGPLSYYHVSLKVIVFLSQNFIPTLSGELCTLFPGICCDRAAILCFSVHYSDVTMGTVASQITSVSIVYSNVCSGTGKRKHQSSTSLTFVRGIHRGPVNSPHKRPVTRKMSPFDDVIMPGYSQPTLCVQTATNNTIAPVPMKKNTKDAGHIG